MSRASDLADTSPTAPTMDVEGGAPPMEKMSNRNGLRAVASKAPRAFAPEPDSTRVDRRLSLPAVHDCPHPRANHQHGTYLAYQKDGCRCLPCKAAGSRQHKRIKYATVTGTHSYVDAAPVREHVTALLTTLTVGQIEARSGVNRTGIRYIVGDLPGKGAAKRVANKTAAALLTVRAQPLGPESGGMVDATGTRRRLRALVALGWPCKHLTARAGWAVSTGWRLLHDEDHALINARTRADVLALYDELALRVPPPSRHATRARNLARRYGWTVPLAWDDDSIDDPAAQPHVLADERNANGTRRTEHVIEDFIDTWPSHRGSVIAAAFRLGMNPRSLAKTLARARASGIAITFSDDTKPYRRSA